MAGLTSRRRYANTGANGRLSGGVSAAATTFPLVAGTGTGMPATPFTAILDYQTATEEVILVTGLSGDTITACTRGYDGTSAQTHATNASFVAGFVAKDADEANDHTSSTAAHGTTGPVVGTTDAQTITNKTVSSSVAKATATDPAWKTQAFASGTAPQIASLDSAGAVTMFTVGRTGAVLIQPTDAAVVPLAVKLGAAQTADAMQVQSSAAAVLLAIDSKAHLRLTPTDLAAAALTYVAPSLAVGAVLQFRDNTNTVDNFVVSTFGEISTAATAAFKGFFGNNILAYPLDASKMHLDSTGNFYAQNVAGGDLVVFRPGGNVDTGASASFATWLTLGNVVVPAGYTKARLLATVGGAFVSGAAQADITLRVAVGAATETNDSGENAFDTTIQQRIPRVWQDRITGLSAGSQSVVVQYKRVGGTGALRVDVRSLVSVSFEWEP